MIFIKTSIIYKGLIGKEKKVFYYTTNNFKRGIIFGSSKTQRLSRSETQRRDNNNAL